MGRKDAPDRFFRPPPRPYIGAVWWALAPAHASTMNDLRTKPFDFAAAVARAGLRPDGMPRTDGASGAPAGGFRTAMDTALKEVSQSQFEAQRLQRELTLGNPTVSLEDTMMAMQNSRRGSASSLPTWRRMRAG